MRRAATHSVTNIGQLFAASTPLPLYQLVLLRENWTTLWKLTLIKVNPIFALGDSTICRKFTKCFYAKTILRVRTMLSKTMNLEENFKFFCVRYAVYYEYWSIETSIRIDFPLNWSDSSQTARYRDILTLRRIQWESGFFGGSSNSP